MATALGTVEKDAKAVVTSGIRQDDHHMDGPTTGLVEWGTEFYSQNDSEECLHYRGYLGKLSGTLNVR